MFYIFRLWLGLFLVVFQTFAISAFSLELDPNRSYTAEELGKNFVAVHLTSVLPKDGIIEGIRVSYPNPKDHSIYRVDTNHLRGGSFWALGQGIHDHTGAVFSTRRYGIMLPFKETFDQLLNVSPHDVFVLGDFNLKNKSGVVVFIPSDESLDEEDLCGLKIQRYSGDLRQAIAKYIREETNTWECTLESAEGLAFGFQSKAWIDGFNVNTPVFFKELLKAYPHVSFGQETVSFLPGKLHEIRFLRDFSAEMQGFLESGDGSQVRKYQLEPLLDLVWETYKDLLNWCDDPSNPLRDHTDRLKGQLLHLKPILETAGLDLQFRKEFGFIALDIGQYLKNADQIFCRGKRLVDSPNDRLSLLEHLRGNYDEKFGGGKSGEKVPTEFSLAISTLVYRPWSFVKRVLDKPGFAKDAMLWESLYWSDRYMKRSYGLIPNDGITEQEELDLLQEALSKIEHRINGGELPFNVAWALIFLPWEIDRTIKTKEFQNRTVKLLALFKNVLVRVPKITIQFENEVRTWIIKDDLIALTGQNQSPLNEWPWEERIPFFVWNSKSPY